MARNFGMVGPYVTRCEQCEDSKTYVERVWGSERGFEHLTDGEYMVVSQDNYTFLCFASHCSSLSYSLISSWTSRGNGRILALCLYFHVRASLPALSYLLPSQFSAILMSQQWDCKCHYSVGNDKLTSMETRHSIAFLNGTDVWAPATPLTVFLKQDRTEVIATTHHLCKISKPRTKALGNNSTSTTLEHSRTDTYYACSDLQITWIVWQLHNTMS